MKRHHWWLGISGLIALMMWTGCASSSSTKEMSEKDEARYKEAIEKADAENPPQIEVGDSIIVNMGRSDNVPVVEQAPAVKRSFDVSREEYDAFFNQSPAVILGRMVLEPIHDGPSLLGYRIKSLSKPFEGVDLVSEDIIVGINGKMPRNPDEYFNQWQSSKADSECVVNIQRGVDRFDLSWHVR